MKTSDSNKKLLYSLRILEVVIQTLAFLGLTFAIVAGALNKPDSELWRCFVIIIPVVTAYFMRRYIRKFSLFMAGNVMLLVLAVLAGQGEDEKFFFFVLILAIVAYSTRLKSISNKQVDMSNVAINVKEESAEIGIDNLKDKIMASEKVPMAMAAIMVIGYMSGYAAKRSYIMNTEVIICILFVLLQVIYNNLRNLNTVIVRNNDKSEFPAKQLAKVNKFTIIVIAVLMLIGMLLFYNGEYGNIFEVMGKGAKSVGAVIVKLFLLILGSFSKLQKNTGPIEETTAAAEEDAVDAIEEAVTQSPIAEAAAEMVGVVLLILLIGGLVYLIISYVKDFNKTRKVGMDTVEYIKSDKKRIKSDKAEKSVAKSSVDYSNMSIRKMYKKSVIKGMGSEKPNSTFTPDKLTRTAITNSEVEAKKITEIYEKARYSDEKLSEQEIAEAKNYLTGKN